MFMAVQQMRKNEQGNRSNKRPSLSSISAYLTVPLVQPSKVSPPSDNVLQHRFKFKMDKMGKAVAAKRVMKSQMLVTAHSHAPHAEP